MRRLSSRTLLPSRFDEVGLANRFSFFWEAFMLRSALCATALAVAAAPCYPQEREQLKQLQQRIERLEAQTKARGQAAFNPEMSLILQGTAARIQRDPETYEITGFAPSGGEVGPPRRGLSLGE